MSNWITLEHKAAAIFGTIRRPLSGSRSGLGGSDDAIHPRLYLECKHAKKIALCTLWHEAQSKAKNEGKSVVLAHKLYTMRGMILSFHEDDAITFIQEYLNPRLSPEDQDVLVGLLRKAIKGDPVPV